jgi:AcrR family transcriptional regulator
VVQNDDNSGGKGKVRRGEILRQAAEVFRRRGFHGAGMREIASALGMTPGALYYYFTSKEELLYQVQTLALENLIATGRAIAGSALPPPEKIEKLIRAHLAQILGEMGGGLAHVEFHALPKARLREVVAGRDEYDRLLREMIEEGIAAGAFRDVDSKLAALSLLGSLNWTALWWRPEGPEELETVAHHFAETFLRGIAK